MRCGSVVKCKLTGFVGTIVAKTQFINGCIQYEVLPKEVDKDGKYPEAVSIDEQSLEKVRVRRVNVKSTKTGGPTRVAKSRSKNY